MKSAKEVPAHGIRDNHKRGRVSDGLIEKATPESTLSIVSAYFTIHAAGIRLFDACDREHISRLATLNGATLQTEAEALAQRVLSNSDPIYARRFDLKALDEVRIIEARD